MQDEGKHGADIGGIQCDDSVVIKVVMGTSGQGKVKDEVKGGGQECPPYISLLTLALVAHFSPGAGWPMGLHPAA